MVKKGAFLGGVRFATRRWGPSTGPEDEPSSDATPTLHQAGDLTIELRSSVAGAKTFYTTDNAQPSPSSDLYVSPFLYSGTGTLRARAFVEDQPVGGVLTATILRGRNVGIVHLAPSGGTLVPTETEAMALLRDTLRTVASLDAVAQAREQALEDYQNRLDSPGESFFHRHPINVAGPGLVSGQIDSSSSDDSTLGSLFLDTKQRIIGGFAVYGFDQYLDFANASLGSGAEAVTVVEGTWEEGIAQETTWKRPVPGDDPSGDYRSGPARVMVEVGGLLSVRDAAGRGVRVHFGTRAEDSSENGDLSLASSELTLTVDFWDDDNNYLFGAPLSWSDYREDVGGMEEFVSSEEPAPPLFSYLGTWRGTWYVWTVDLTFGGDGRYTFGLAGETPSQRGQYSLLGESSAPNGKTWLAVQLADEQGGFTNLFIVKEDSTATTLTLAEVPLPGGTGTVVYSKQ